MSYYIFKVVIIGIIIVIITETAKFNLKLAALITAMPIVTLLCIFWMYYEGMEKKEISEYVFSTLKYLIPTIPMFILFPILIERTNFYITIFLCCLSIMLLIYLLKFKAEKYVSALNCIFYRFSFARSSGHVSFKFLKRILILLTL